MLGLTNATFKKNTDLNIHNSIALYNSSIPSAYKGIFSLFLPLFQMENEKHSPRSLKLKYV